MMEQLPFTLLLRVVNWQYLSTYFKELESNVLKPMWESHCFIWLLKMVGFGMWKIRSLRIDSSTHWKYGLQWNIAQRRISYTKSIVRQISRTTTLFFTVNCRLRFDPSRNDYRKLSFIQILYLEIKVFDNKWFYSNFCIQFILMPENNKQ